MCKKNTAVAEKNDRFDISIKYSLVYSYWILRAIEFVQLAEVVTYSLLKPLINAKEVM